MGSGSEHDDKFDQVRAQVDAMTPEQREAVRVAALDQLARRRRVLVDGKVTSLKRLQRRVDEQRRLFESGAFDETIRTLPRWQQRELVPGTQLRQGAEKMQLRQREEAELELDRFGRGYVTSARPLLGRLLGPRHDFAWGIYARPDKAEKALAEAWAGQDPAAAAGGTTLYQDVVRHCHNLELTLMLLTSRPLPLAGVRQEMQERLERSMRVLAGSGELRPRHKADLADFVSLFDDKRVEGAGWVGPGGTVRAGTHFVLSTTPDAHLLVEAITPGPIRAKRTSRIGVNRNKLLTGAVFDVFLGAEPVDEEGKRDVGHGMLWAANGFRFRPWEVRPGQYVAEPGPDGQLTFPEAAVVEAAQLPLQPSLFQLLGDTAQRMLLRGVRRAQRATDLAGAAP